MIIATLIANVLIGFLAGTTGMGGILLPPVMVEFLGLDTHLAMGTSLASFLPTTLLATWLHVRLGNIDWAVCRDVGISGLVCTFFGTQLKAQLPGEVLNLVLAVLILWAGYMAFRPVRAGATATAEAKARLRYKLMLLGGSVGVVSGLTGAGGPVLTVPGMIVLGFSPIAAIATGQAYSVLVSVSGTVGNAVHGAVDFTLALACAAGQMAGLWVGVRVSSRLPTAFLKRLVAVVCLATGVFILARTLLAG